MSLTSVQRRKPRPGTSSSRASDSTDRAGGESARGRRSLGGAYALGPALKLGPQIQTKLTVGTPGDRYEREADHVADRVASGRSAGDISRIPAGGLKTQRQAEEGGGEEEAQTLAVQREPENGAESESEPAAQSAAEDERKAQAQSEPPEEGEAQTKCAACEGEEKTQRQEEEGKPEETAQTATGTEEPEAAQKQDETAGDEATAQTKCATCEAEDKATAQAADNKPTVQRQAEDEGDEAQTEGGEEEAEGGGEESGEAPEETPTECGPAGGGSEPAEAEGEEGGGRRSEFSAGPECGEGGGEGGGEGAGGEAATEAAAGGGAGGSCAGGAEPAAEGGGGGAGPAAGPPQAEGQPPAPNIPGPPACAEETVDGAGTEEEETPSEGGGGGAPAAEPGARHEACKTAQTKPEEGADTEPPSAQGAAEQEQEASAQSAGAEEQEPAQRREQEEESSQAQPESENAESEHAQAKEEEEPSTAQSQTQEEESTPTEQTQAKSEDTESEHETEPQRAADEEETTAQSKEEEQEQQAQTRSHSARQRRLHTSTAARHMHARGAGEPLLPSVRDRIEASLGVDLEGVRVHADSNAQTASKALRAKAFTHRNHIFLGPGQSQHDVGLMAHESTHVLQQDGVVRRKPRNEPLRETPTAAPAPPEQASAPATDTAAPAPTPAARVAVSPQRPVVAAGTASPDVARVPAPPAPPVPIPYPTAASPGGAGAATVKIEGKEAATKSSALATSKGEEAGTATRAGVISAVSPRPGPAAPGPGAATPGTPAAPAEPEAAPAAEPKAAEPAAEEKPEKKKPGKEKAAPGAGAEEKDKAAEAKKAIKKKEQAKEAVAAAAPPSPEGDPRFEGVMSRLQRSAAREKSHAPAKAKASAARAAVEPPANERPSRAEQKQVAVMEAQPDKPPEPEDFLTILRKKIEEIAPHNMEETLEFKKSGKVEQMKSTLTTTVGKQKEAATGPLRQAAKAPPDVAAIPETKPTPLPAERPDAPARRLHAAEVLPQPKPEAEISAEDNKKKAETLMAENDIDEDQLKRANEPQFTQALKAKHELDAHADAVPGRYREQEKTLLQDEKGAIGAEEAHTRVAMRTARTHSKGTVHSKQEEAKKREEAERRKIADDIRGIYRKTKEKVEGKLNALDGTVGTLFDNGERAARERFETDVQKRMEAYKDDRYSGIIGKGKWAWDKLTGMPDEVNAFYTEGRDQYIADMRGVLEGIATKVDAELAAAKKQIADGKQEIADYVSKLEPRLQGYGKDAQDAIAGDFDQLEGSVEDKKQSLADDLTQRYRESRRQLDERIEELKAENQGLLDKFVGFIKKVIEVLRKLKDMIVMLVKVGGQIIRGIIKDPSGFLDNLLGAIKQGFNQFRARIGEYLQRSLFEYISGTVRDAGISAPPDASPSGVFGMVLQILGITPEKIRAKVVRLIGARNVERIELAWRTVSDLLSGGAEKLWERAKAFLGDLKERVAKQVREWVITQIIKRGIVFLLSLFNPVSALLRAIKMIYDLLMFFVENIDRIVSLVNAVLQSVSQVVMGNVATAAKWIEQSLARGLTTLIAFLARLLGLSGLADRIRAIIKRIQRPVDRAIDAVLRVVVRGIKWVGGKVGAAARKGGAAIKRFLFPRRVFRAGAESHRLFFRGGGDQAPLMIASDTKTLEGFLAELRARPENKRGANKAALDTVAAQIKNINRLRKQIDRKPDAARAGIDAALAVIAEQLAKVLASGDFATEANPLPLAYPKRASSRYPRLYAGPRVGSGGPRVMQAALEEAESDPAKKKALAAQLGARARKDWQARGLTIERFDPHGKQSLPEGGETIGLDPEWQTSVGKKLKVPPPRSTPGGGKINKALKPYGFSPRREGLDGDHVTEIQLGGQDVIPNLWPLDKSENRSAGSIISSAKFDKPGGGTVTMAELKTRAKKKSVWLVITSTK